MNTAISNTFGLSKVTIATLMLLTLVSCGGGGGSESSPNTSASAPAPVSPTTTTTDTTDTTTTESYDPDASKQEQTAENTDDLYVEQSFEFNTYKVLTIDIQAVDDNGLALANTLLFVSSLPDGVTQLDDEKISDKSLMSVFKTNSSGAVYDQLEISNNVNNVLLELNTLGIENEVIVALAQDNMLQYQFK